MSERGPATGNLFWKVAGGDLLKERIGQTVHFQNATRFNDDGGKI